MREKMQGNRSRRIPQWGEGNRIPFQERAGSLWTRTPKHPIFCLDDDPWAEGRNPTISNAPKTLKSRSLLVTIRFTPALWKEAASRVSSRRLRPSWCRVNQPRKSETAWPSGNTLNTSSACHQCSARFPPGRRGVQTLENTSGGHRRRPARLKGLRANRGITPSFPPDPQAQFPPKSLASQRGGPRTSTMNKAAKLPTSGSPSPRRADRSVNTPNPNRSFNQNVR